MRSTQMKNLPSKGRKNEAKSETKSEVKVAKGKTLWEMYGKLIDL
jgi:hypothetical protein